MTSSRVTVQQGQHSILIRYGTITTELSLIIPIMVIGHQPHDPSLGIKALLMRIDNNNDG